MSSNSRGGRRAHGAPSSGPQSCATSSAPKDAAPTATAKGLGAFPARSCLLLRSNTGTSPKKSSSAL
eukprot:5017505-Alexandrium_andersonii.AAC.1